MDPAKYSGLTSDTAAASCWEIKQLNPTAPTGSYWLLTPAMSAPAQFWCDQDTDGGGWVKVGQGRQNWEYETKGRGSASSLLVDLPAADSGTVQLPTSVVDGLLNSASVSTLDDGIRVRRALDTAGTTWQEVRFKPTKSAGFYWTMGALWPLTSWSIGSTSGTSGTTSSFGTGSSTSVVDTTNSSSAQNYTWSFSYGSGVAGSSAASSYLWSATNNAGSARPFSFVYVRPKLMSANMTYSRIANSGTPKSEQASVPDANAMVNPWGVTGMAGVYSREGDVEVQDMVAIGNTMYVGGAFKYVQRDSSGTGQVQQSFLAAFNATTGEFISTFKPVLNEQVLAVSPTGDGRLAIGGKFTTVGGQAAAGFAIIDATTGALSGPQPTLSNSASPGSVRVEVIKYSGGDLFIGGSFTHTTGPTGATRYTRNASRINAATAMPVVGWAPEFNGSVNDLDLTSDGSKAFYAGFFTQTGTVTTNRAAALPTSGSPTPYDWTPTWSSTNDYQRTIETKGNRVYVGGSEHSMFSYDINTFQRLSTHITNPKGDFQTLLAAGDFLYGGSHSNWFIYQDATNWPSVGSAWTRADGVSWITAWKLGSDGKPVSVPSFTPAITSRTGEAGWATAVAPDGTIWAGGDFTTARLTTGAGGWTGAFVRFGFTDGTAPNTPTNFRSTATTSSTVTLAWSAPSGGIGSGGSYQILRDNRVIASTTSTSITVPLDGERRYFVRAADKAGNLSASTSVVTVAGGNPAPVATIQHTVSGLDVAFDASQSTDDGSISAYYWSFGDGTTSTDPVVTHHYPTGGSYQVQLTVVDNLGAWTTTVVSLDLTQPVPSDPYGAAVYGDQPWAYWRLDETSGTTAADASATGQHPAAYQQGVTQGVDGIIPANGASRFDGVDDVVVSTTPISGPTTYSEEAWFRTTTTRGGKIIGFGGSASGLSSSYDRHVYMQDDGRLVFGVYVGGEYTITTDKALNDGLWHHVVATQSSDGMKLYVDGSLTGTNAQTSAEASTGYWRVGGDRTWGSTSSYFAGDIDDAAIYTTALTATQVQAHYAKGWHLVAPSTNDPYARSVLSDSPSVYWRLDNSQLGTVPDASGNGQNGVVASSPVQTTNSAVADGIGSMTFDGTDDGVGATTSVAGPTSYASEIWFRTTTGRGGKLMGFGNNRSGLSNNYDRHVYMLDDGRIVAGVWTGSATTVTSTASYNDGRWHYVVAQLDGSTLSLYVDSVLIGSATLPAAIQAYNGYWRIGGDTRWAGSSDYFAGDLDEFAVYPGPLALSQIQTHYATGTAAANQLPTASFTPTVDHLAVSVDGSASSDPDGTVASYKWDFGDGSAVVEGTSATATHTYTAAGAYTVTLTVTDNRGGTATTTQSVTAVEPDNQLPTASFTPTV
ncbi:LamG-like jellyroll fold domain-containing protein, partial [Propionicimonas sp.]|uniref:LamG-like jellyroll fold domain-containing protein n=1 Tax=Propionicimonas sp. TaxID=1955623 RepID=UPI0039E2E568